VPATEVMRIVAGAGGRRPPPGRLPAPVLLGMGRVADGIQRIVPARLPIHNEGSWTMINMRPFDASATVRDLGVEFRPARETLVDAVRGVQNGPPDGANGLDRR
jgi:dihydroflavonol-4-reductase